MNMSEAILKVENLHKHFGSGRSTVKAVDGVSFQVNKGEVVLIMGPSGSGKTTLLTIVGSLLSADSGHVYYNNTDISSLQKSELPRIRSKEVGFVFQSFNLIKSLNVWENVAIVLELGGISSKKARERAVGILSTLGLGDRLDQRVLSLSGGEKQRVSIARALATNPDIVLADEPTANLDSQTGHRVAGLLADIATKSGKAVVIVSHDMRLMDIADRVLWLEDGKLKEGNQEIAIDPTCEMELDRKLAPFTHKVEGQNYYFCSKKCLTTLKSNNKYI